MDIVLLPCHRRPEFLFITLECILKALNASDKHYIFLLDDGWHPDIATIIDDFPFSKEVQFPEAKPVPGNSFNILSGFSLALSHPLRTPQDLIFLIEEDIWISPTFFIFHTLAHFTFNVFAVSAVKNHHECREIPYDPAGVYFHKRYQSLGVSFTQVYVSMIVKHHCQAYYRDPAGYCKAIFSRPRQFIEQDGLIDSLIQSLDARMLYPCIPRAYHAGFVGYNRPGLAVAGSLHQRIRALKALDCSQMNDRATHYKDIDSHMMTSSEVTKLHAIVPGDIQPVIDRYTSREVVVGFMGGLQVQGYIAPTEPSSEGKYYMVRTNTGLQYLIAALDIETIRDVPTLMVTHVRPLDRCHGDLLNSRKIMLVIDAGADSGAYAKQIRASHFTGPILSFEPRNAAVQQLLDISSMDESWTVINCALTNYAGYATLYDADNSDMCSLIPSTQLSLRLRFPTKANISEEVKVTTLDSYGERFSVYSNIWLSINVQGSERDLLDGAAGLMPAIKVIDCVIPVQQLYENQMTAAELVAYLCERGFTLRDVHVKARNPQDGSSMILRILFAKK